MVKHFFALLLLLVSLVNAANADVAEFFSEACSGESCITSLTDGKETVANSYHEESNASHRDCDQADHSATHQCHIGHCQFTANITSISLLAPTYSHSPSFAGNHSLQSILPSAPIKPPRS